MRLNLSRTWPWIGLAIALVPAVGLVSYFPTGIDEEFPLVERPTFSPYPPAAYRLAEPGDTLDRVAMYLASACVALSAFLLVRRDRAAGPRGTLPLAGLGLSLAAFWYSSTPWPTFDGWHGLGWRVLLNGEAPAELRLGIGMAALIVLGMVAWPIVRVGQSWPVAIARARLDGTLWLLVAASALVLLRLLDWPKAGPEGYWPRWAMIGGMWLLLASLVWSLPRQFPAAGLSRPRVAVWGGGVVGGVVVLVGVGLTAIWYHRPIDRLREIEPGKIYISAMPHGKGLEVAHRRHRFKTIINLFQEDLPGLRSPHLDAEIAFARQHGIHYIRSPIEATKAEGFMSETLRLATDPDAWPILVHCHGCMDRAPAWWGIYAFLHQGRSLREILQAIEQHRGSRPKGSVTLLYNRVLAERAPERFRSDPDAELLVENTNGTPDPYLQRLEEERRLSRNPGDGEHSNR